MALAGIGGNSIESVKANLTAYEVSQWREYRLRRGSLNVGRRVEQSTAHLMAWYHNGKVKREHWVDALELMPHEDDVEIGFEEQMLADMQKDAD